MPTITQETVQGYAHCGDSWCPGNEQEPVTAVRERTDTTYAEKGGTNPMPGIENTSFRLMFADRGDVPCAECGKDREVADQERPVYPQMARVVEGQGDQRYLLGLIRSGKIVAPGVVAGAPGAPGGSDELALLRRELAELRGFVAGQQGQALAPAPEEVPVPEPETPARPARAHKGVTPRRVDEKGRVV